jgi:DNA-binding CsgD family transcriptional regulator
MALDHQAADQQIAELDAVLAMLRALAEAETADDFCRALALDVLVDYGVVATYVARLDSDGRISMIGSYGYSQQRVENTPRPSIWENMSITETIRTGKVMVYETWDQYIARYPDKGHLASPGQAFVCLPIRVKGVRSGGLGITFINPIDNAGINPKLWDVFAAAADVFLTKGWAAELARRPVPSSDFGEDEKFAVKSLSERELDVLKALAVGKTNASIAREFSYSESTIKQDTIKIFKVLGVKSRKDAVLAAKTLGLIAE